MKYIKMCLKVFRFTVPIDNMRFNVTPDFIINFSKIMYWFSFILFLWNLIIDIITLFTMPYNLIDTIIFLFVCVSYTVFLWYLMKYKKFTYGWFFYSLLGMGYLIWHLPQDMKEASYFWGHIYAGVDIALGVHTAFYNLIGFCAIYKRIIYVLKD